MIWDPGNCIPKSPAPKISPRILIFQNTILPPIILISHETGQNGIPVKNLQKCAEICKIYAYSVTPVRRIYDPQKNFPENFDVSKFDFTSYKLDFP